MSGGTPVRIPKIQLLHVGCSDETLAQARAVLHQALAQVQIDAEVVEDILVETEEQSAALGLVGGPAIMVDGVDVDPNVRGMRTGGLGCRAYLTADGFSPAPPLAMVLAALSAAMGVAGSADTE
jgi:hypothetical protein